MKSYHTSKTRQQLNHGSKVSWQSQILYKAYNWDIKQTFKQHTSSNACSYQCMTYLHLPFSNTAPMTLIHGHVNEWRGIKTKKP